MKKLFEPVAVRNMKMKNRLVRSATWEGVANPDGSMKDAAFGIYEELALGGVGCIITGFTSVSGNDRYFDGMMRLSDDSLIPQYKKLTDMIHLQDCPVLTQLALGGFFKEERGNYILTEPDGMTEEDIKIVIRQFARAALRAEKAGFDGVQLHAAHFFFLSRFISPVRNHRKDEYGGSLENRARILTEIIDGIRREAGELHISVKINSSDFTPGGIRPEDCVHICRILDEHGIDSIEISGNGTSARGIRAGVNEGYFAQTAAEAAKAVSCPVMAVGGFRSVNRMEEVLRDTGIELISMSRPLIREPDLPLRMKENANVISTCVSCNACYATRRHSCIYRR